MFIWEKSYFFTFIGVTRTEWNIDKHCYLFIAITRKRSIASLCFSIALFAFPFPMKKHFVLW